MSGHTPGPWRLIETHVPACGGFGARWVCEITCPDNNFIVADVPEYRTYPDETPTIEANARLIAAAPELLEACQTFAEWLRREDSTGCLEQPWRDKRDTPEGEALWREWFHENLRLCALAQEQARAAIAKATGGAE